MAKYYRNKEELHEHYFDIFKDIVDSIATSEYEEDLRNTPRILPYLYGR